MKQLFSVVVLVLLTACASDNEHFCARYAYVYDQLNEPGLPSYSEMKEALVQELNDVKKDKDKPRFMLFVLEDFNLGIKPEGEASKDFCVRMKRWARYQ